ncbi:hypothetical protein D3C72_2104840 [compost metagenome]
MRIRPDGSLWASPNSATARSIAANAGCKVSNRRCPSSVSDMSRVVRCSNRTFSCPSSAFKCCERAARDTSISMAALVKLR